MDVEREIECVGWRERNERKGEERELWRAMDLERENRAE